MVTRNRPTTATSPLTDADPPARPRGGFVLSQGVGEIAASCRGNLTFSSDKVYWKLDQSSPIRGLIHSRIHTQGQESGFRDQGQSTFRKSLLEKDACRRQRPWKN